MVFIFTVKAVNEFHDPRELLGVGVGVNCSCIVVYNSHIEHSKDWGHSQFSKKITSNALNIQCIERIIS